MVEQLAIPSLLIFGIDIIKWTIDFGNIFALTLAVCLTLNLEAGYAGVPNFGKVLFVAGGATIAGSVCGRVAARVLSVDTGGNFNKSIPTIIDQINKSLARQWVLSMEILLLGIVLAAGVGAAMGFFASYPAIRLREDYLGMLLLASAQFFQLFLSGYEPFIGGTQGLEIPDVFRWAGSGIGVRDLVILAFTGGLAILVYLYVEKVARSPLGRTLRAIRDNEEASRALGKNDVAMRRRVIIIASAISGIAGALLAFYSGSVEPGTWTRIDWTFYIWVMVIIGGSANNLGVALGAFSFTFLVKALATFQVGVAPYLPAGDVSSLNWLQYLIFGGMLILILVYRPGGIIPEKSSATLPKATVAMVVEMGARTDQGLGLRQDDTPRLSGGRVYAWISRLKALTRRAPKRG